MVIKRRQTPLRLLITLVIILVTCATIAKTNLLIVAHDSYEAMLTQNPGFSSSRNLIDSGGFWGGQSIIQKSTVIVKNIPKIVKHLVSGKTSEIPKLSITIKFSNLTKINDDRLQAINEDFLDSPQTVKAIISHNDDIFNVKIRLKGDLRDHWYSKYRYSLRVNLKGTDSILGMKSFSIQKPRARQHPYEQAFQTSLKEVGNLTSSYHYAFVEVNGEKWGIMNLEEHLSPELLEKQRKKDAPIFRFSDDKFWKNYWKGIDGSTDQDLLTQTNYLLSDDEISASIVNKKQYLSSIPHRKIYTYVLEKRLELSGRNLYSEEEHANLLLHAFLWNNFHTLTNNNTRYYFNPYTLKLAPISSDQEAFSAMGQNIFEILKRTQFPSHFYKIFDSNNQGYLIEKALIRAIRNFYNIDTKLNSYKDIFPLDVRKTDAQLKNNIKRVMQLKKQVIEQLSNLKKIDLLTEIEITDEQAKRLPQHISARHYDNGEILIFNLIKEPVNIEKIISNGEQVSIKKFLVPGFKENQKTPIVIKTDLKGIMDGKITVVTSLRKNIRVSQIGPTLIKDGIYNPFDKNNRHDSDIIEELGPERWIIKSGTYEVKRPINVKGHLIIEPGVKLLFKSDTYFLLNGSIDVVGTPKQPVIFDAKDNYWKGLYLISNSEKSSIRNMKIENTRALSDGILNLSGGFTVYNSDISIVNLSVNRTIAEDAVNFVNSRVDIDNLSIRDSHSDSLDCDFCVGTINNSSILGSGGDGFDFSGSHVLLNAVTIEEVKDKAISAGENSVLTIRDSAIDRVGVGIASKDSSEVKLYASSISNYKMYAGMTYQKKTIFDRYSSLIIQDSNFVGKDPFIRQFGTELTVDGAEITGSDLKVRTMYAQGIMKK